MDRSYNTLIGLSLWLLLLGTAHADLVVVVSKQNPIRSLTRHDLEDIFLGRSNQFPDGGRVVPIDQKDSSPAHDEFYREYLGRSPAQVKAHWSKLIFTGRGQPPRTVTDGDATVDLVGRNPNAIGYVDSTLVNDSVRIVPVE